jgi:hypothetical protein
MGMRLNDSYDFDFVSYKHVNGSPLFIIATVLEACGEGAL